MMSLIILNMYQFTQNSERKYGEYMVLDGGEAGVKGN